MRRTILALAALLAAGALLPAAASAQNGGDSNAAAVENRSAGSSVLDLAFSVRRVAGDTVDQTNQATAYASCETCQSVAIAIQVVIVTSEKPSIVNPTNVAAAVGENCTTCATFAGAYQLVVGNGGPVRLTAEGRRELQRVRQALVELRRRFEAGNLSVADVKAAVTSLTADLKETLRTELVPVKGRRDSEWRRRGDRAPDLGDDGRPRGEEDPPLPPVLEDEDGTVPGAPSEPTPPEGGEDGAPSGETPGGTPTTPSAPGSAPPAGSAAPETSP